MRKKKQEPIIYKEKPLFRTPVPGAPLPEPPADATPDVIDAWEESEFRRLQISTGLPHLYGWKWYPWAAAFRDSTNQVNLLCAGNQISKSSTQIRKCILWATDQALWPSLWQNDPVQFWYLYPTKAQVNAEFETKWKQFLPRNGMEEDPHFGFTVERSSGNVVAIHFNSGVHVYFKTYAQNAEALQTGSCDALFADEELNVDLFDELMLRISASSGYFHMVFTATKGQDFWRRAMEPGETEREELPDAWKMCVGLYDAMVYEDGTPSHWTIEKIKKVEARCSTHNEVLKRVHGKFISIGGRKYEAFDIKRHMRPKHPLPKGWHIYAGADIGGGGAKAHKSALCYVAVSPNFRQGRVFLAWREDLVSTTAGDVVEKHIALTKQHKLEYAGKHYDWNCKDFGEIATRMGHPFEKAEKHHDIGEEIINTLFKNDMMIIYEDEETVKLAAELASLKKDTPKNKAKDDLADAFRYCITKIPWDWSAITGEKSEFDEKPEEPLTPLQREIKERRQAFEDKNEDETQRIQEEFEEWNDAYG